MAYTFPGFELTGNADTDRFKVDIGTIRHGERQFVLHLLLSQNAPKHATPSVASVAIGDEVVWKYNRKLDTHAFSRLALVDGEPVVAYVEKDSGNVSNVEPFSRLGVSNLLPFDVKSTLRYKRGAAAFFGTDIVLTLAEHAFVRVDSGEQNEQKRVAELVAKRQAEREAEHRAREEARQQKRALINGREQVSVKTTDGRYMSGRPVLREELPVLEPLQFYVLVGSFDEAGQPQDPQKAFKAIAVKGQGMVMANGGTDVVGFAEYKPKPQRPEPIGLQVFEIEGGVYEVPIYADKAAIDLLVEVGVTAIEFAAYPAGNSKFAFFALKPTADGTKLGGGKLVVPYGADQPSKAVTPEDGAKPKTTGNGRPKVAVRKRSNGSVSPADIATACSAGGQDTAMKAALRAAVEGNSSTKVH